MAGPQQLSGTGFQFRAGAWYLSRRGHRNSGISWPLESSSLPRRIDAHRQVEIRIAIDTPQEVYTVALECVGVVDLELRDNLRRQLPFGRTTRFRRRIFLAPRAT
jgi:hypothetical protein